jgi:large subunit ribosomal protein L29
VKPAQIRALSEAQLDEQLTDLHSEWRELRFQEAIGKLTATARIRQIRRDIARIHTIRTERRMEAEHRARASAVQSAR